MSALPPRWSTLATNLNIAFVSRSANDGSHSGQLALWQDADSSGGNPGAAGETGSVDAPEPERECADCGEGLPRVAFPRGSTGVGRRCTSATPVAWLSTKRRNPTGLSPALRAHLEHTLNHLTHLDMTSSLMMSIQSRYCGLPRMEAYAL